MQELNQEKIKKIEKGDLYELLSVCSDEELEPLVKIITSKFTNFLEVNDIYKLHKPRHSKYYKAIGDEIRSFGGHSAVNLFRDGPGPEYEEIVIDVCKALDIPPSKNNTAENEDRILKILLEKKWKSLSKEEQEKTLAEAQKKTSSKVTLKTGFLSALAAPISLAAAGANLLLSPALSTTTQCVLQIAFMRHKILEAIKENKATSSSNSHHKIATTDTPASSSPALIVTGEKDDKPILSLSCVPEPSTANWNTVKKDEFKEISRLNPLLQSVPSLVTASDVSTTKYMEVVINGPLVQASDGNGLRCMTRGIEGGLVKEHGRLFEPTQLSNIVNASALFQVASVAVAQKHLADISEKLSDIKSCVDKIHNYQKNDRKAKIIASAMYFEQVANSVLSGEITDAIRNQLESYESDLLKIQNHLFTDIENENNAIANIEDRDKFGTEGIKKSIEIHQSLLSELYNELFQCIRARACGWQLLLAFPGNEILKRDRRKSIQIAIDKLGDDSEIIKNSDYLMEKKVKEISALWNRGITLNERKLSLLGWGENLRKELSSIRSKIVSDLNSIDRALEQPAKMLVQVSGDEIIAVCTSFQEADGAYQ